MDYFTLLLPILLIAVLLGGLVLLKRHLFSEPETPAPIAIPEGFQRRAEQAAAPKPTSKRETAPAPRPVSEPTPRPAADRRPAVPAAAPAASTAPERPDEPSLSPARPYPRRPLTEAHMAIFSRLLKALPGYVVLPKVGYDHFIEARDGSPSENKSLQNRAAQHVSDFLICDRKLRVLLVCQVEDGTHLPARLQEREKLLQRAGLRLLRWKVDEPPEPESLLSMVRTLEKITATAS